MLKELVQEIASIGVKATAPQIAKFDPTQSVAYIEDGKLTVKEGKAPRRSHTAFDLQTIVNFAIRFVDEGMFPVIWYSRDGIVCIIDDGSDDSSRLDKLGVPLTDTEQIGKLEEWTPRPLISQRDIMYQLRTTFADCTGKHPNLQTLFAKIDWEAGTKTSTDLGRGKSSIGKSVKAEAGGLENLPEQITLTVPVFAEYFARKMFDVRCALEIHEGDQKFQLFPLPGEMDKLYASAEAEICGMILSLLGDKKIPVYYGNP